MNPTLNELRSKTTPLADCWLWTSSIKRWGYGYTRYEGRGQVAHRVAWQILRGPIPTGMVICHKCDNPPCINPDHLFIGTQSDNMRDARRKGNIVDIRLVKPWNTRRRYDK